MNPFQDLVKSKPNANVLISEIATTNDTTNDTTSIVTTNIVTTNIVTTNIVTTNVVTTNVTMVKPRTPRSLSRIQGMTVGDVRQCFSQMRDMPNLTSNTTLWCGMTAGNFAFQYLVNTAGSSRRKLGTTSVNADKAGL